MMNDTICTYAETRDELLLSYLYDEIEPDDREAFDRHLVSCALCRSELNGFHDVRVELGRWSPPEPASLVAPRPASTVHSAGRTSWMHIPAWAQVAAATLVFGVAAGFANLEVSYAEQRLSVRTGWQHAAPAAPAPAISAMRADPVNSWRSELAALEQRLRSDLAVRPVAVQASAPLVDDVSLRRVRALLQDSEQQQQREMALRFAEMAREVESQRQADLVKIDRRLGLIQSRTGMEVMRTQQQVNSLAQRVSQRQ